MWFIGAVLCISAVFPILHTTQRVARDQARIVAIEASDRHQVDARALEPISRPRGTPRGTPRGAPSLGRVQWFANGTTWSGTAQADRTAQTGEHVRIWVSEDGRATTPPRTARDAFGAALTTALELLSIVVSSTAGLLVAIRWGLDRARLRTWSRMWHLLNDHDDGPSSRDE